MAQSRGVDEKGFYFSLPLRLATDTGHSVSNDGYSGIYEDLASNLTLFGKHVSSIEKLPWVEIRSIARSDVKDIEINFFVKDDECLKAFYKCSKDPLNNKLSECFTNYSEATGMIHQAGLPHSTKLVYQIFMPGNVYFEGKAALWKQAEHGRTLGATDSVSKSPQHSGEGKRNSDKLDETKQNDSKVKTEGPDVKESVQMFESKSGNPKTRQPGSYPNKNDTLSTKRENSQTYQNTSGKPSEPQQDQVEMVRKKFIVYVPNERDHFIASVKIKSDCKLLDDTKMTFRNSGLFEGSVTLPVFEAEKASYWYEAKMSLYVVTSYFYKNKKESQHFGISDASEQLDLWEGFEFESVSAHLLDIVFCTPNSADIKERIMAIEKVCQVKFNAEFTRCLIMMLVDKILGALSTSKALFAVALGNILSNYDVLYRMKCILPRQASAVLQGLRQFRITDFPSSCESYMESICTTLCCIAFPSRCCLLTTMEQCYPFIEESLLNKWVKTAILDQRFILALDQDDMLEAAASLCTSLYQKHLSQQSSLVTQSSDAKELLERLMRHLPFKLVLHIFRKLSQPKTPELSSEETDLQKVLSFTMKNQIVVEITKTKRNQKLSCILDLWKSVSLVKNLSDEIKGKFESEMVDLIKKAMSKTEDSSEAVMKICNEDGLYEAIPEQMALLQALADSPNISIHGAFIAVLEMPKFERASDHIGEDEIKKWLNRLVSTHLKNVNKGDKVVFLYSNFSGLMETKTLGRKPEIHQALEDMMITQLNIIGIKNALRKLEDIDAKAEPFFRKHLQSLIGKKTGQKGIDMLLVLCGTGGDIRINSRLTGTVVCSLLEVYCPLKEEQSEEDTFSTMVADFKLWEKVFLAYGTHVDLVKTSKIYKRGIHCLQEMVLMFKTHSVKFNFVECLGKSKEDSKKLLCFGGCSKTEINRLWKEAQSRFEEEKQKLADVYFVLKEGRKNISTSCLPNECSFLPDYIEQILKYTDTYKVYLANGKLTAKDLKGDKGIWKCMDDLPKTCQSLKSLVASKVFWNLCNSQVCKEYGQLCKEYLQEEYESSSEDSALDGLCNLFGEVTVGKPHDEDDVKASVTNFFRILKDTGIKIYRDAWLEIQTNEAMEMTRVTAMFSGCFSYILEEMVIAEKFLVTSIVAGTKKTLEQISQINDITHTVKAMKSSLSVFGINMENENIIYEAVASFEKLQSSNSEKLTMCDVRKALQTVFDIAEKLRPDTINILNSLGKGSSLLKFLQNIVDDDIRNLIDAVEDISEQHVQESTVSGLIEVKRFLYPLLKPELERSAQDLFYIVEKQTIAHGEAASSLPAKIDECMANLHNLKSLYKNVANRGEQTKETIKSIVKRGTFQFILDKGNSTCDFKASYKQAKKPKESRSRVSLVDLRSRALLLMNTERKDLGKHMKSDVLEKFVGYIDLCLEIADLAYNLHKSGHVKYLNFTKAEEPCGLKQLKGDLHEELKHWQDSIQTTRMSHFLMNFVQGTQIHTLYNYLERDLEKGAVETLLKYIHPDMNVSSLRDFYFQEKEQQTDWDDVHMLHCMGQSLHHSFEGLGLHQRTVTVEEEKAKRITDVVQNGKLLVVHLEESSLLVVKTILALFSNTTQRLPEANQVLFCMRETTWSELQLFLCRCLGAHQFYGIHTLFSIANVEMLPNEIQFNFVESLAQLKQEKDFLLAIVCRGSNNHPFIDKLSDHVMTVRPSSDKTVCNIFLEECPNVCTFTSEVAGVGKTNTIRKMAHAIQKGVVTLHISGAVNKRILVEQLRDLKISTYHVLHLDIGDVENHVELDTFLFEMIILRHVTAGTVSVSLPTSHISIEIANTIKDSLRNSLQTAVSFRREHLIWNNYNDYIVSQEVQSPVQVVCHFLNCLEKGDLDMKDLLFSGTNAVTPLSANTCRNLLQKYFNTSSDLSFSVLNIFLNVLADQLKKMSCSAFFRTSRISDMIGHKTVPTVRSTLATALIEVSKEFSSRSVNACRSTQVSTLTDESQESYMLLDLAETATKRLESMIQWEESNHLIYVFHNQNIQTISPMYRDKSKVPDHIRKLFEGQMKKQMQDFKSVDQSQLQIMLQKIARTDPFPLPQEKLQELARGYALTPDNLLKMVLIMLRITANIPVVVMGETGCGKTSLIRYLAEICEVPFNVMNIHAGVEEHAIVERVLRSNEDALKDLDEARWLFLDEINTCEHLGMISDIICHHRCLGKLLAPNLVVMGACNPYKLRSVTSISTAGLQGKVKTDELSRLVYRVLPLPEMLVDYVWDFGSLSEKDEEIYIKRMVEDVFPGDRENHELLSDLLSMSQQFIRDKEKTTYSVSLRDVQRCKDLTEWFVHMLEKKSKVSGRVLGIWNKEVRAMILSLAHCYHSRFSDKILRKEYRSAMENIFRIHGMLVFEEKYIHDIIKQEQRDILDRMELPPGTAKNTALQENVFVILVCILNRMPVFVVGKPGCSKSLAMQIIRSNLRGKDSNDKFFKTLPQLYCVSFQGSESSTSDGIIKVFEKAEKYQDTNTEDEVLSVVILDEIGLAEVSRFNPLKVLHNLLEPDGKSRPNVAVVGISNWSLDASKMNRAIHLSRPEMDVDELFETGISISDSFVTTVSKTIIGVGFSKPFATNQIKEELEGIAKSYFCYTKALRFGSFHGLRDFYSLVKFVARTLSEADRIFSPDERSTVIMQGIERNFGGLPVERETLLSNFKIHLRNLTTIQTPVVDLITDNVKDPIARHLMLITTGESVLGIVEDKLIEIGRYRKEVIFGSKFEEDLTDDYNYRILSRIILCMEEGLVLILKDLENIYGSLYDMLNQNYTVIGKKKNCRVALGPYSNPICHVADTFRCIVLVDESKIDFTDPPFLNRFEKHYLRFADIISAEQEEIIQSLEAWMDGLSNIKGKHFTSHDTFPIYSEDMVASLILKLDKGNQTSHLDMDIFLEKCKSKLLWIIRPEVVVRLAESLDQEICNDSETIRDKYFRLPVHEGMEGLMIYQLEEDVNKCDHGLMTVVFTNSNIHTKVLHSVAGKKTQVDKLGAFKSEKQLSLRMQKFWLESEAEVLFLQCSAVDDEKHIMLAKSVIERYRYEFYSKCSNSNKHVYLVIHMDRSKGTSRVVSQINFLSDWKLVMLDCLECPHTPLPELCSATLYDTIMSKRPLNKYIEEQLFWTFTRIRYTSHGRDVKSITEVLEQIKQSSDFLEILDDRICTWITSNHPNIHNTEWQVKVACDSEVLHTSTSFVEALETQISSVINVPLSKTVYRMEVMNILDSYFIQDAVTHQRRKAWESMLDNDKLFSIKEVPEVSRNIPEPYTCESKDLCLKMPFSSLLYENIETTRDEFLDSLTLLKGKCDLDEDDDLPPEVFNELLLKQESFVLQKIPDMTEYLYESWTDDYIDDFCNLVSYTTCSSLPKLKRIGYMKWAISQKTDLSCKDPSELFIRLHSTFWAHLTLFTAELQLFETCSELLLDEKDDLMQTLTRSSSTDIEVSDDECSQMVFENVETRSHGTCLKQSFTETIYQTDKHDESEDQSLASPRLLPFKLENIPNSGQDNPNMQPMANHLAEDLVCINMEEGEKSFVKEKQNSDSVDVVGMDKVSIYFEEVPQDVEATFERKYTRLAHEEMEDRCSVAKNTSVQQMDRMLIDVPLEKVQTNMVTEDQPLQSEKSKDVDHLSGIQTEDITFEVEEQMEESAYVGIISNDGKGEQDTVDMENSEIVSQEPLLVNSEYQKCVDYSLEKVEGSFNLEERINVTVKGDFNVRGVYNHAENKYPGEEEDSNEEKQSESDLKLPLPLTKSNGGFTGLEVENFRHEDTVYTELQEDMPAQNPYFSTGATSLFKSFNVNYVPDAKTDNSPEDVLVDIICRKMLPTKSTLEHYKGLSVWQSKVNCVLTLAAQVSLEPQSIHTLRFCNDVAAELIIPFSLDVDILQNIGQLLQQDHDLDSTNVFQALMNVIESAPPMARMVCQRILSKYFVRCLSSNRSTSSLSLLLLLVLESRLPDKSFSLMKSPLQFALHLEIDENVNVFTELLHGRKQSNNLTEYGEDLLSTDKEDIADRESGVSMESSFLSDLDQCLKQMFLRGDGDDSFVVLLVDLMEEIYSESFEDDTFLAENDSKDISLFLSCHKILKEAEVGLQYIAAVAYFKTFIQSFVRVMEDEDIRPNSLAAVNGALQDIEETHVSSTLLRFFLKALGINSILGQVIKHCARFQQKLPFLEKIPWTDVFFKESFDSCPLSIHVPDQVKCIKTLFTETQDVNKVKEQLALISNEAGKSAKGMVLLYSVALKHFYIPRSYMTLDDTRKTYANLFLEEVMASLKKQDMQSNTKLLKCLVGKEDFKVPEYMPGEGSEPRNFLINSFLTSLYGLLLAFNTFSNDDKLPILAKCLLHPSEVQNCFLPGFPDNNMQPSSILDITTSLPRAEFASCQCGHRIAVHDGKVTLCIICRQPLSLSPVSQYSDYGNIESKAGFISCPEMNDVYFGVRGMSPVVCNILYILTKGCLLGSLAVGLAPANKLKEATSDMSDMDISQTLWEDIECHWENISKLLNLGDNRTGLLLHTTLRHTRDQLCENRNAMKTAEERMSWEKEFSCKVSQILKDRFQMMNQINTRHLEMHELPRNCIEQSIHELDDPSSLPPKERLALMPTLFRIRGLPTKENFMYELHEQKHKFPFLMLALRHCEELELPIHIFNIVQWHIAAASNANYMMKKHECENMTVTDFVYKSQDEKKKDIVRKRFDAFQKSWIALKDNTHIGNFDRIHGSSKMSECLILGTDSVVYKVLQKLVAIQNNFLDKALEMAPFCHAVNFLSREPNVSVLPCIELSEVKKQHLLCFEWNDSLLQESQCDLSYSCGRHMFYDFRCIEKDLAINVLVGRSSIHLEKDALPRIIFTDELFKNYASLVRELKEGVKQVHLPSEVIAGVKAKKENDPRMATELLTHLGVIMTLLKKTKGDPEKPLVDYAEEWKILLTRKLPDELLPSPQSSVKLCHVVALHELLEELNSDAIIDALEDQYRAGLDLDLENHFKNVTNDNVKLAELILKAIKRFTQRCLSLREADPKQPLHSYLSDESFWPDGMVVDGGIQMAGKVVTMVAILPEGLMVRHVYSTVTFIEAEMEKQRQNDTKMSKLATNWQGRSKDNPSSKAVSKKKTARKYKNH